MKKIFILFLSIFITTQINAFGFAFSKTKTKHHKKKHHHHQPHTVPASSVNPERARILANNPDTEYENTKIINDVIAQKQQTETAPAAVPSPEIVIPALTPEVVPTELAESFELHPEILEIYGLMSVNPTSGSDDTLDGLIPQAHQAPQELGYTQRAHLWLKNSWAQVPSVQQLKVSCGKAFDELQLNAYKHRMAIAAVVTVALVAGGGYYWYKNYKAKKAHKN